MEKQFVEDGEGNVNHELVVAQQFADNDAAVVDLQAAASNDAQETVKENLEDQVAAVNKDGTNEDDGAPKVPSKSVDDEVNAAANDVETVLNPECQYESVAALPKAVKKHRKFFCTIL